MVCIELTNNFISDKVMYVHIDYYVLCIINKVKSFLTRCRLVHMLLISYILIVFVQYVDVQYKCLMVSSRLVATYDKII